MKRFSVILYMLREYSHGILITNIYMEYLYGIFVDITAIHIHLKVYFY